MKDRYSFEKVKNRFLNNETKLIFRNLRGSQKEVENLYWELISYRLIWLAQKDELTPKLFSPFLESTFSEFFVEISTTLNQHLKYFNFISREKWEKLLSLKPDPSHLRSKNENLEDGLEIFMIDLKAKKDKTVQEIISRIVHEFILQKNLFEREEPIIINLFKFDNLNQQINQPISEILKLVDFSQFITDDESNIQNSMYSDRKLVRMLHKDMKTVMSYRFSLITFLTIQDYFVNHPNMIVFDKQSHESILERLPYFTQKM